MCGGGFREREKPKFEFIKYSTIERFTVKVRFREAPPVCDRAEISINLYFRVFSFNSQLEASFSSSPLHSECDLLCFVVKPLVLSIVVDHSNSKAQ